MRLAVVLSYQAIMFIGIQKICKLLGGYSSSRGSVPFFLCCLEKYFSFRVSVCVCVCGTNELQQKHSENTCTNQKKSITNNHKFGFQIAASNRNRFISIAIYQFIIIFDLFALH